MFDKISVVLLSGGMDSAVTAAMAIEEKYKIAALHVNYGQLTEAKEFECFNQLCDDLNVEWRLTVDISHLKQIGGSSLTDKNIHLSAANLHSQEIPNSYVPFRNANILAIATSWAEVIGASALHIGAVSEDSSGYPDTRPEFFESFQKTIETGTKGDKVIQIMTPIINFSKSDIVKKGKELGVNFAHTWSCYGSEANACGECDSCALRLRGFEIAEIEDPIDYTVRPKYAE